MISNQNGIDTQHGSSLKVRDNFYEEQNHFGLLNSNYLQTIPRVVASFTQCVPCITIGQVYTEIYIQHHDSGLFIFLFLFYRK